MPRTLKPHDSFVGFDEAALLAETPKFSLEGSQALLKDDDDLLRSIFLKVFQHHHPDLSGKLDTIFNLAQVGSVFSLSAGFHSLTTLIFSLL